MLVEAAQGKLERQGHRVEGVKLTGQARAHYGDVFSGNNVTTTTSHQFIGHDISGTTRVHFGNRYDGGKSVSDD